MMEEENVINEESLNNDTAEALDPTNQKWVIEFNFDKIFEPWKNWELSAFQIFIDKLKLLPYLIFWQILYIFWFLLIPQKLILQFWKIAIPVIFTILIITMLIVSWSYIWLPYIDWTIFWEWFMPVFWVIPWAFMIMLMFAFMFKTWKFTYDWKLSQQVKWWILGIIFVILGLTLYLWWSWTISSNILVFINSFLWYLIYFSYIFIMINIIFMLYKKVLYIWFSLLNRETWTVLKQWREILLYLFVIVLINTVLNVQIILF